LEEWEAIEAYSFIDLWNVRKPNSASLLATLEYNNQWSLTMTTDYCKKPYKTME
jgi:hypothetical protein